MRVNKILFSKLRTQYEVLKMRSAYILAERDIVTSPELTGWEPQTPEAHHYSDLEAGLRHSLKDAEASKLLTKMERLEEQGREALENEDYEKMRLLKQVYDILKNKLNKL